MNTQQQQSFQVAALYRFSRVDNFEALRAPLAVFCHERGIKGTLLLAAEGINGTVAGSDAAIADLIAYLESIPELSGLEVKFSRATTMPFHRMKVRLKREIVTMGVKGIDPTRSVGTYVEPTEWNALISDPETVVVDTRNTYEISLGTFRGAVDPETASFRDFPAWLEDNRSALKDKKLAMFCTGGIRCEKATAYAKAAGFNAVFHLKGGILKYLEDVPAEKSLWQGECFVFDERVSVTHGLTEGEAQLCRACRQPLTKQERLSPHFIEGVSCPHCFEARSDADRARYRERQKQVELAQVRGSGPHIGAKAD
ncbi:rhodanese-related sulfurtransferase [Manganibacter manganicus]|uniref:tRNA uridine(34) hydroxylase n=1 Tax=Manganibacter manganicus TaxID=1873176 RepID=A0A1V8RV97_9HYPH|nr:rhodanese-related sulfurtransferase [Pseudaminobacter manganicus]OQM77073.1 hypothetical protein BFN67_11320 [Pseudaminobacter manganicus]